MPRQNSFTPDDIVQLTRRMREAGVTKFSVGPEGVTVEMAPEFVVKPLPIADGGEAAAPFDPSKCVRCQKAPANGIADGLCRKCSIDAAIGTAS